MDSKIILSATDKDIKEALEFAKKRQPEKNPFCKDEGCLCHEPHKHVKTDEGYTLTFFDNP